MRTPWQPGEVSLLVWCKTDEVMQLICRSVTSGSCQSPGAPDSKRSLFPPRNLIDSENSETLRLRLQAGHSSMCYRKHSFSHRKRSHYELEKLSTVLEEQLHNTMINTLSSRVKLLWLGSRTHLKKKVSIT